MMMLQLLLLGLSAYIIAADEWVYPKDCIHDNSCIYKAKWTVKKEDVKFEIVAKQPESSWTGIGMAREKKIDNSEFIWGYKGKDVSGVVVDGTYPDEYSPPTKDAVQKLDNPIAYYSDGYLTLTFTHKRISYDIYEFNLTDTDCYYFIFPVEGGSFVNDLGVINKPYQTPKLSDDLICFHEIQVSTVSSTSVDLKTTESHTTLLSTVSPTSVDLKTTESHTTLHSTVPSTHVDLKTAESHTTLGPHVTTEPTILPSTKQTLKPIDITDKGYMRVCYYTNWSQHRGGNAKFLPGDIDPCLCTHLVFAYANISEDNTLIPTELNDDISGGLYEQFNFQKQVADLKTMLAVGGWEIGIGYLSQMLKTVDTRKVFIDSAIKHLRKHNFDGIDLNFPCLGAVGSLPEDKTHFTSLIEELSKAVNAETIANGKDKIIISLSIPALADVMDNGYEVDKIHQHLDFINLKTDDLIDDKSTLALHHTALYPGAGSNAVDAMKNLVSISNKLALKGAPRSKTNIGVATYGRGFTLKDPNNYDIGAPVVGPSPPGECTQESGILAYYEICPLFKDPLAKKIVLKDQKVPYIVNHTLWIGYDDMDSLITKVNWLKDCGHAGYVVSTMDTDDFKGQYCNQGPYPLMNILSKTLLTSVTGTPLTTILKSATEVTKHPMSTTTLPEPTCVGRPDGLYPYPGNCTVYIQCSNQILHVMPCPSGLYYDPANLKCNFDSELTDDRKKECDNEPSTTEVTEHWMSTTILPVSTLAPTCVGRSDSLYPYPGNCTVYIQCSNQILHVMPCPSGLYYDPAKLICNFESELTDDRKKECDLN